MNKIKVVNNKIIPFVSDDVEINDNSINFNNNGNYFIEDIWGNTQDIRECEMIVTESSLKLCYIRLASIKIMQHTNSKLEETHRIIWKLPQNSMWIIIQCMLFKGLIVQNH